MATIYHASSAVADTGDFDEMQISINNYWGEAAEEKIFLIPFWKALQLLSASPSEQIALHVTDFNNRSLVDAQWESYNDELEPLLAAKTTPNEFYFVMHESVFQNIRASIPKLGNPVNQLMLWGRLGETTPDGNDFVAFLIAAKGVLFPPGGGGGGASTGIKLPPTADD